MLALQLPLFALAQATPNPAADEVVVTGSRFPESLATAVRPVRVITAQDIRASGAATLAEVLATLGGMETVSTGGQGQPSGVFIRGANSAQTVVLVDGVRIGSATLGTVPMESLPLALIERVEVLAGASSSLYGADAVGGVIQVFTKRAGRTPQASMAVTVGDQGLRQLATTYTRRMGDTDISLGANMLATDGINATTPDNTYSYNPDRDGYRNQGYNARLSQRLEGGHLVDVQWLRSDNKVHFDDGAPGDSLNTNRTQTLAVHWAGPLGEVVDSDLRVARSWDEATTAGAYPARFNTQQDQLSWLNRVKLAAGTLTAGLEWLEQRVDSDTVYVQSARNTYAGLLGWRARYGALGVQADLRHDQSSAYGGYTTAQLGGAYQVGPDLRLRASAGTAFKAPSFNEMYYPGFGNVNLKPERSQSFELGAEAKVGPVDLSATLFDNRMRDLIDYAPPDYLPVNVANAKTSGLTFTAATALGADTRARLSLTLQDPKDSTTGHQLRRRAQQFGSVHLSHRLGDVQLGTDLTLVGERFDSSDEAAYSRMGGYGLVAMFASWQFRPEWSLEGRVSNLGDKPYTQAQGYTTPGRLAQVTLRWTPAL